MNLRPIFHRMLKRHGAYNKFYYCLKTVPFQKAASMNNAEYFKKTNPSGWIDLAFRWSSSKNGDRFWRVIHSEWREIIRNITSAKS